MEIKHGHLDQSILDSVPRNQVYKTPLDKPESNKDALLPKDRLVIWVDIVGMEIELLAARTKLASSVASNLNTDVLLSRIRIKEIMGEDYEIMRKKVDEENRLAEQSSV